MDKFDLINAIVGAGVVSREFGNKLGSLCEYHGGFNDDYEIRKDRLIKLNENELKLIYNEQKSSQMEYYKKHNVLI